MRHVFVGFACNNECRFCAQGGLRDRALESVVLDDLDAVAPGQAIAFVGGEPTRHAELPAWVARARALGAGPILVQTNGRLMATGDLADELRSVGVTALDVSLQGATAAMHDYHTSVSGSFAETCRGVRAARAAGLAVGVTTVATRSNYRHLSEIVRLAHALGADAVHLAVAQPFGRALGDRTVLPPIPLLARHWTAAVQTAERLGMLCLAARRGAARGREPTSSDRFAGLGLVDREAEALVRPAGEPSG